MAVNRIFGRDPGTAPKAGFTQIGGNPNFYYSTVQNPSIGVATALFDPGDPQISCCAGPDESLNYVIAYEDPGGRPAKYQNGVPSATYTTSYIGFAGTLKALGTAPLFALIQQLTGQLPVGIDNARAIVQSMNWYASW